MDRSRSWMKYSAVNDRRKAEYVAGVNEFLEFAFRGKEVGDEVMCPCMKCCFRRWHVQKTIRYHLFAYGIVQEYNPWVHHGEPEHDEDRSGEGDEGVSNNEDGDDFIANDDVIPMICDAMNLRRSDTGDSSGQHEGFESRSGNSEVPKAFFDLKQDAEADLYLGCKTFKRLEFINTLLKLKVRHKWSDTSFSELLKTLHRAFNYDKGFPKDFYQAKRYKKSLGLDYVKIDACVNHCVLFWKENAKLDECPKCHTLRWKEKNLQGDDHGDDEEDLKEGTRVQRLVLLHFPLIPRLQRMFMISTLARDMRWHKEGRPNDDVMRHPADSKAWEHLDQLYPDFAADPRNVRLALASDGFSPGTQWGNSYSIWPVFVVPYNLPPWICMKSENIILSLLIPGPKAPGNDIDVFLQPLIDELKQLWEVGVSTFDAHSGQTFNMRAVLMWTVQDFPAYANLSGWSTMGLYLDSSKLNYISSFASLMPFI